MTRIKKSQDGVAFIRNVFIFVIETMLAAIKPVIWCFESGTVWLIC